MRVFRAIPDIPAGFGPSAITVGKFDGVHAGHQAILAELRRVAAMDGLASVVVTFDRNPLETLAPDKCPQSLVSLDQKLELLADAGVDATLVLCFDTQLASLSADEFVQQIVVDALDTRTMLVGKDFRFGSKGAGTVSTLQAMGPDLGFTVRLIDDVGPHADRRVSSTWIRELLASGDVAGAAELLGRLPAVRGVVVPGAKRGRELGFPTANLSAESEGLIPADGVYAGWLSLTGQRHPAAISVGNNPTFEGVPAKQVEAYVLDRDIDLYDKAVQIVFAKRIRAMVAFDDVDSLVKQIRDDVRKTRELLA